MTIYVGLDEIIEEKLKKGIFEPSIECKDVIRHEQVQKLRNAVMQAYNTFNGTCYTDYITGHNKVPFMYSDMDVCEIEIPLLKRFLFPIYEEDFQKICLEMKNCSFEETVKKLLDSERAYEPSNKSIVYIIPYIKSDWVIIKK